MSEHDDPRRKIKDYKNLSRSLLQNHLRSQRKKKYNNSLDRYIGKYILWAYHYLRSRFGKRHPFVTYENSVHKGIYKLDPGKNSGPIKIALAGDWGSDTAESEIIAGQISAKRPHYTIHLGDTYFVGSTDEIKDNFQPGKSSWYYGSVGSFALAGNHEMYSNGNPYFDKLLNWMGVHYPSKINQRASYFCLENDYWRVIGLDTGYRSRGFPVIEYFYSKAQLHEEILKWIEKDVKINDDQRGIIFLTHHQYVSCLDKSYSSAGIQLAKLIGEKRKVIWIWGHEHRFAMYGNYNCEKGISAYGRCIGNGGMPETLHPFPEKEKIEKTNLVLYDNRYRATVDETEIGHNGYSLLEIDNDKLCIKYYDEEKLLVEENWIYDSINKTISGKNITVLDPDLTLTQNSKEAVGLTT